MRAGFRLFWLCTASMAAMVSLLLLALASVEALLGWAQ